MRRPAGVMRATDVHGGTFFNRMSTSGLSHTMASLFLLREDGRTSETPGYMQQGGLQGAALLNAGGDSHLSLSVPLTVAYKTCCAVSLLDEYHTGRSDGVEEALWDTPR